MAIKRQEIVGKEGGKPPIVIKFWEGPGGHWDPPYVGDRLVGIYWRQSMDTPAEFIGEIFDAA